MRLSKQHQAGPMFCPQASTGFELTEMSARGRLVQYVLVLYVVRCQNRSGCIKRKEVTK